MGWTSGHDWRKKLDWWVRWRTEQRQPTHLGRESSLEGRGRQVVAYSLVYASIAMTDSFEEATYRSGVASERLGILPSRESASHSHRCG